MDSDLDLDGEGTGGSSSTGVEHYKENPALYGTYGASLEQSATMATPPRMKGQGGGGAAKKKTGTIICLRSLSFRSCFGADVRCILGLGAVRRQAGSEVEALHGKLGDALSLLGSMLND